MAATNPTAGEEHAVAAGPVVASGVHVDLRRAAEFAHPHDERGVEQAALFEVVEQRGVGLLHRRDDTVLESAKVVLVRVRRDARAVHGGDEARARLHEPAREQVRLAPRMPPVALAHGVGLAREVERLRGFSRLEDGDGLVAEDVHFRRLRRDDAARLRRLRVGEIFQKADALREALGREARVEREVAHFEAGRVRVVVEHEGIELRAEAAAVLGGRDAGITVAMRERRDDIRRHARAEAVTLRKPSAERADARDVRAAGIDERAVHAIRAADGGPVRAAVVAAMLAMHGADERDFVHALRHAREDFGNVGAGEVRFDRRENAAHFRAGVRLWIPEVNVARRAAIEDED